VNPTRDLKLCEVFLSAGQGNSPTIFEVMPDMDRIMYEALSKEAVARHDDLIRQFDNKLVGIDIYEVKKVEKRLNAIKDLIGTCKVPLVGNILCCFLESV